MKYRLVIHLPVCTNECAICTNEFIGFNEKNLDKVIFVIVQIDEAKK